MENVIHVIADRDGNIFAEFDVEIENTVDFQEVARGFRNRLDCSRVVIIHEDKVVGDTNNDKPKLN